MTTGDGSAPEARQPAAASPAGAGRQRVWLLNLALAAVAVTMYFAVTSQVDRLRTGEAAIPVLLLAGLFAATEIFVVHIKFRHDAHTFSLSEIPLMLGLFFCAPTALVAAQLIGGGTVLVLHRRQTPIKLVFNLAGYAASVLVAVAVFRGLLGSGEPLGARAWASAATAAMCASLVVVPAIYLAVTLSDGRPGSKEFLRPVAFSLFAALVTSSVGLIAVVVLAAQPVGELLLLVPTLGSYVAYRAYVGERDKHQSLQFLYDSTRLLHQSEELDDAVDSMLVQAREALRADVAVLAYQPTEGDAVLRNRVGPRSARRAMEEVSSETLDEVQALLDDSAGSLIFDDEPTRKIVQRLAGSTDLHDGIIVALRGETRVIGALVVANHLSEVTGFLPTDVRLLETLAAHLSVALENGRLEQSLAQLRVLERQLTHQAHHDALTGLANQTLFSLRLTEALVQPDRCSDLAVLFIDIDDFKTVNDSLGHAAGDALLITVADRLNACLRDGDLASRLGGDEFALLLDGVEGTDATAIAERVVLDALATPATVNGHNLTVRVSIGIALASTEPNADADTLMRNGDTAMYNAKARGKACLMGAVLTGHARGSAAEAESDPRSRRRRRQRRLRRLLPAAGGSEHGSSRGRRGAGALGTPPTRHPRPGYLHRARRGDRHIRHLTRAVIEQACQHAATWPATTEDGAPPAVSVNLSSRDFDGSQLPSVIASALQATGLPAQRLMLEITETLMLTDLARSVEILYSLVDTGVQIALDDFGTGYCRSTTSVGFRCTG